MNTRSANATSNRRCSMMTVLIMLAVMMYTMVMITTATTATIYTLGVIVATDANRSTE